MPTRETALVIRIFLEVDSLLQSLAEAKSWHWLVNKKTWDRWLDGRTKRTSPETAGELARSLWDSLHKPNAEATRALVFERIVALAPDAASTEWIKEPTTTSEAKDADENTPPRPSELAIKQALFGEWFSKLAAQARQKQRTPEPATVPLTLNLEVLVGACAGTTAEAYRRLGPENLPVKAGQALRVRITTSRPVYLYVWWVSPGRQVIPLYPWKSWDWRRLAVEPEQPGTELRLPWNDQGTLSAWPITAEQGLETLVALAREQPMPRKTRAEIRRSLAHALATLPALDPGTVMSPGPHEAQLGVVELSGARGLGRREHRVKDPVGDRHRALDGVLGLRGDAGRCLSFLNAG